MNEQIKYADPWIPVGQYAENLVKELQREVTPSHVLWGCLVQAIAQRTDCDDVLFKIEGEKREFAVVHLTWSGEPEPDSRRPDTRLYPSLDAWVNDCMMKDHHEYLTESTEQ